MGSQNKTQREIKFRQPILSIVGKFISWKYWGYIDGQFIAPDPVIFQDDISESQEYTGLEDKKGKEIYEGDIVRFNTSYEFDRDDYSGITKVEWIEKEAGFYPFTLNNRWRCDVKNVEVIGNVMENPELVK